MPALEEAKLEDVWFQQDGATAHNARVSMNFLKDNFPQGGPQLISVLPGFNPCDFFLWGVSQVPCFHELPPIPEHP
jgi:hypothetical protein